MRVRSPTGRLVASVSCGTGHLQVGFLLRQKRSPPGSSSPYTSSWTYNHRLSVCREEGVRRIGETLDNGLALDKFKEMLQFQVEALIINIQQHYIHPLNFANMKFYNSR